MRKITWALAPTVAVVLAVSGLASPVSATEEPSIENAEATLDSILTPGVFDAASESSNAVTVETEQGSVVATPGAPEAEALGCVS